MITKDLHLRKICATLVPKFFIDFQRQNRVLVCEDLFQSVQIHPEFSDNFFSFSGNPLKAPPNDSCRGQSRFNTILEELVRKVLPKRLPSANNLLAEVCGCSKLRYKQLNFFKIMILKNFNNLYLLYIFFSEFVFINFYRYPVQLFFKKLDFKVTCTVIN